MFQQGFIRQNNDGLYLLKKKGGIPRNKYSSLILDPVGVRFIEPLGNGLDESSPYRTPIYCEGTVDLSHSTTQQLNHSTIF